jgi:hypothetical protein
MENQNLPLEKELEPIFAKFPAFPENIKELLVQIAPYFAILIAVLGGLAVLTLMGMSSSIGIAMEAYGGSSWRMWLSILSAGASAVFCVMAFKPLQSKQKKGWDYMWYVSLISLASNVLSFNFIGAIIGGLIGFWILFQIKSKYTSL